MLSAHGAEPQAEIVVSIRYPQPTGESHAHLVPAADTGDIGAPDRWEVRLQAKDGGKPSKTGELAGYSAGFLSRVDGIPGQCILHDGNWNVAFCFVHLDSTEGNTVHALDLQSKHATPYPLPGQSAFSTLTANKRPIAATSNGGTPVGNRCATPKARPPPSVTERRCSVGA